MSDHAHAPSVFNHPRRAFRHALEAVRRAWFYAVALRMFDGFVVWCENCGTRTAWHRTQDGATAQATRDGWRSFGDCSLCHACTAKRETEIDAREAEKFNCAAAEHGMPGKTLPPYGHSTRCVFCAAADMSALRGS